jgi:O-antigen ligase
MSAGNSPSMKRIFCQGWEWNFILFSLLLAPVLTEVAAVGIFVALVSVCWRQWKAIALSRLNQAIGGLVIWLLVVSGLSPRPLEALLGLANFLPFFFLFVIIRQMVDKPSRARQLAWVLVIPSVWVVFMGLGQIGLGWGDVPFTRWAYTPYGDPRGRMSSVFMYANILGAYLLMILSLTMGLIISVYRSWRRERSQDLSIQLGFLAFALIFDSVGLFLTNSRNAWGLAFGAALLFALYLGWRSLVWGFGAIAGGVAIASWGPMPIRDWFRYLVPAMIWVRLSDEMFPDRPVATLRSTQWRYAWEMVQQRPIFGWGLRNFSRMYKADMGIWMGHPHNLYLMILAETGAIGLLIFCLWVGWIYGKAIFLYRVLAQEKTGAELMVFTYLVAFGGCVLFNFLDVTIAEPKVNTIAWILFGSIAGLVAGAERERMEMRSGY